MRPAALASNDEYVAPDADRPTIAYALSHAGNARLLERVLCERYRLRPLVEALKASDEASAFDVAIVDAACWRRLRAPLDRARRACAPVVMPVLLVVSGAQAPDAWMRRELGVSVDDVVHIPVASGELVARIDNMQRLRRLSLSQAETQRNLSATVRQLRALHTCDEILMRARDESRLLSRIARAIAAIDGYPLVWIGFPADSPEPRVAIHTAVGRATPYLNGLDLRWDRGVMAEVAARRKTTVVTDIQRHREAVSAPERALAQQLRSMIVLPLPVSHGREGWLAIHAGEAGHFGAARCRLLARLAGNLTLRLDALRLHRKSRRQAARIRRITYVDALSGLPNRLAFRERLRRRLAEWQGQGRAAAVLFIDLDGLRLVNDALGYAAGDEALRWVALRLRQCMPDPELVARQGSDGFVAAVADIDCAGYMVADRPDERALASSVLDLAARIRSVLSEPIRLGEHVHRQSATIGISLFPAHGTDADALIEHADTAMHEAKRASVRAVHIFDEPLLADRRQRLSLENRLHDAIRAERLTLHYQPVFRLDDLRIVGVEALVRWPQPDGGLVLPGEFLPIAEETGLIVPLGAWVLRAAAQQLQRWHAAGRADLQMMVNVSVRQLQAAGSLARFAEMVAPHVPPSSIELEITESTLMADPETVESCIVGLHRRGFRFAIDDFGTGYSSLSRIKNLPFHTLKIDRSFVDGIGGSGKGDTVTHSIIGLARNLSLRTIAEGIETADQRLRLRDWGALYGQGYWFSRPAPPDTLESLLDLSPGAE